MYILLKYKLNGSTNRTILLQRVTLLWYKVSNDINDLFENLDKSSIINQSNFYSWPTHEEMTYLTYLNIDNIKQVYKDNQNNMISSDSREEVLKLIKQCVREYNLIKILEK
jgi:hypothetical protein